MGVFETGHTLGMLILAGVAHCALGILGCVAWLLLTTQIQHIAADDDQSEKCAKLKLRAQRMLTGIAGLGNIAIGAVLLLMIVKIGTTDRPHDDHTVNWTYFAIGEAVAFALLGIFFGIYYWFRSMLNLVLVSGLWALWCILLGAGSLGNENQRQAIFIVSLVIQAISVIILLIGSKRGLLLSWIGIIPIALLALCVGAYDAIWFVGYFNYKQIGIRISERWLAHLGLFIVAAVTHAVIPAGMIWFFDLKAADVKTAPVGSDADQADDFEQGEQRLYTLSE